MKDQKIKIKVKVEVDLGTNTQITNIKPKVILKQEIQVL